MQLALSPTLDPVVERFNLRDYQVKFINDTYKAINEGHRAIACVAPTGSGKTVIMAQIGEHIVSQGKRLLILVHLDVLVGQTYDKLKAFGLHYQTGFIKAGWPENREAPVQIGSVQTLGRRRWWVDTAFDVIIYDEAHTTLFTQVGTRIRYETHPDAIHLAFTATPYRLGKKSPQMGDRCTTLVSAPVPAELQQLGQLATMRYFGLPAGDQADLSGVKLVGGDFSEADLKNRCDTDKLVTRIAEEWHRLTPGKRTIAFCVGVEHANHVADAFRRSGVTAATVTGDTPIDERNQLYRALGRGDLLVLTSCNVISIGFDEPSVEVGLLLRPTTSLALHHQQIGRVMRLSPGKDFGIILDQAGNLLRLGMPEDVTAYDLATAQKSDGPGEVPKKQCPECWSIINVFESICPNCTHQFPAPEPTEVDAELIEYTRDKRGRRAYQSLLRKAYRKGYDPTWAAVQYHSQTGKRPDRFWAIGAIFGNTPTMVDKDSYYAAMTAIAERKFTAADKRTISGWVIAQFITEFGRQPTYDYLKAKN
jgi:superfamily II DNA or RNA helicase